MFSHIYLMGNDERPGLTKIGRSSEPLRRIKELQTGNSDKLHIIVSYYVRDAEQVEKALHFFLGDTRVNGEWFELEWKHLLPLSTLLRSMSLDCRCSSCWRYDA